MKLYRWCARNKSGKNFSGELLAGDDREVAAYVRELYGYVTKIEPQKEHLSLKIFRKKRRLTNEQREAFFRQLASLLNSGMPLMRSLELIRSRAQGRMGEVCSSIVKDLHKGFSLNMALKKLPGDFSSIAVSIVAAGEASGSLTVLFGQLADYYQQEIASRRFLRNACIYPCVVLVLTLCTLGFFVWKVLPLFVDMYMSMKVEPTFFLRGLMFLGNLFGTFQWEIAGLLLVLFLALCQQLSKLRKKALKFPIVKNCYHDMLEVRYCRILAIMLQSGIALPLALASAGGTLPEDEYREQSRRLAQEVLRGKPIGRAAVLHGNIFSPTSLEFISVGENNGSLAEMLMQAAMIMDKDLQARLKDLQAMLEPALMVLIAVLVGCCIFSIVSPMFNLIVGLPEYK